MKRFYLFFIIILFFMPFLGAQENDPDASGGNATGVEANDAPGVEANDAPVAEVNDAPVAEANDTHAANRIPAIDAIVHGVKTAEEAVEGAISDDAASSLGFIVRLGIALVIIAVQAMLIRLLWKLFNYFSSRAAETGKERIKPLTIKKIRLLSTQQIIDFVLVSLKILKYVISGFWLFLTIPIEFSLFPATRNLAMTIFGYVFNPIKDIFIGAVMYIPNLFKIVIFVAITHYVLKLLKFFSTQIAKGRLVLNGFYADWAEPTFKILQVLLWAFTVAIVYPYLPGSETDVFKGVSVFVGLIFSLGSSSAIGNMVAGLVITYMRPFKIGDRVQIKETTGFVVEKNLMVVRLRTHKNEYVTFPNMLILGSSITNYNTSTGEEAEGLILYTEVTFGYATPWEKVHEILINAALATDYVQKKPKPFVLQTGLDNFYARYQINCYTKEVDKVPKIYASLYENIQNGFHEAGMDMTCANYGVYVQKKEKG
jgi:small-conductance mechanosensitive channel